MRRAFCISHRVKSLAPFIFLERVAGFIPNSVARFSSVIPALMTAARSPSLSNNIVTPLFAFSQVHLTVCFSFCQYVFAVFPCFFAKNVLLYACGRKGGIIEIEEYVDLSRHIRADYALTCRGESMTGAGIEDGDIVYIRKDAPVDNGRIAAVLNRGGQETKKAAAVHRGRGGGGRPGIKSGADCGADP